MLVREHVCNGQGLYTIPCCRCRENVEFAIKAAWLLDAYTVYQTQTGSKCSQGVKLRNAILNDDLTPNTTGKGISGLLGLSLSGSGTHHLQSHSDLSPRVNRSFTKSHNRSRSEATGLSRLNMFNMWVSRLRNRLDSETRITKC